jgi:hypothetical protein
LATYNICLVRPPGNVHAGAFLELGELLMYSLRELGAEAELTDGIRPASTNILIGCHLLDASLIPRGPKSTIILNTEQIYLDDRPWNAQIFEWIRHFRVWDYSERNIEKMRSMGVHDVRHLKLGFQKELRRIPKLRDREFDVLFYGSANDRRARVLDGLVEAGINVKYLFGVYGAERDEVIARSRLVLNHHFYKSEIFEVVRVSYLLTNSVAVVGEVNDTTSIDDIYRSAITAAPYDGLVEACTRLVKDDALLARAEERAYDLFSKHPQSVYTAMALA